MPTARETLAAGVINSVLYAVGGDNGSVALGTNEAFTSCLTPDLCAGVTCTATDACHVAGVCDPATGLCSNPNAPDGTACNDGNACTQTDTRQSGTCVGSNPVTCAALDQCHVAGTRSEEHTSELQSLAYLVCRLLLEKKNKKDK